MNNYTYKIKMSSFLVRALQKLNQGPYINSVYGSVTLKIIVSLWLQKNYIQFCYEYIV